MTLASIRRLVADDAHACTFQTFGQYRTALLKAIDQADEVCELTTPSNTEVPVGQLSGSELPSIPATCECGYPMPCSTKVPITFCRAVAALSQTSKEKQ